MTAAESILRTAAEAGVEICFANPGTTEMALVAALDRVPEIRPVLGLFEGVCTGAADGYGRMSGKPALTLLHLGPGFANGIANLHNARRARTPLINLIGDQASWHLAHDAPLTSDIASLARPVSGFFRSCQSASAAAGDMAAALAAARSGPGSIATLVLPADFQEGEDGGPAACPETTPAEKVSPARIEAIAQFLREDPHPISLLLGGSGLCERALLAAGRIASQHPIRLVAETFPARWERGRGLPRVERLPYLPEQATAYLEEDRALLLAGSRSPVSFFGYSNLPSEIAGSLERQVLATPDEDVAQALEDLAEALHAASTPGHAPLPEAAAGEGAGLPEPQAGPLDPVKLGLTLARHLPENAILSEEAATSGLPFYHFSENSPRHTVLALTGGAIGQGLPCATGAALACPERPVIAFQADGSGMYTLQALWTQARENLNVTTLLCSNRAYRILQIELGRAGISEPGPGALGMTSLDNPALDWVALARGCGVPGTRVTTAEELETALPRALTENGPHLIEALL
jgi:acetolactate synthase-1/2/3 large subunit